MTVIGSFGHLQPRLIASSGPDCALVAAGLSRARQAAYVFVKFASEDRAIDASTSLIAVAGRDARPPGDISAGIGSGSSQISRQ